MASEPEQMLDVIAYARQKAADAIAEHVLTKYRVDKTMYSAIDEAIREARQQALEEAAKEFNPSVSYYGADIRDRLRALASSEKETK